MGETRKAYRILERDISWRTQIHAIGDENIRNKQNFHFPEALTRGKLTPSTQ
jgi:hypothetical protein